MAAPAAAPAPRPVRSRSSQDPFFDRPYEPDPKAAPVWEDSPAPVSPSAGVNPVSNPVHKPKRRIATLLGGKMPT
jgi:hypothetical protein